MKIRAKKINPKKLHMQKVAAGLFARNGFDSVSIIDIGNAAGLNSSMVSYYFGGKMELYDAIATDLFNVQTECIKNLISIEEFRNLNQKQKITKLGTVIDKFVDFFYNEISPDMVMLLLREQQDPSQSHNLIEKSPLIAYLRELIGDILGLSIDSKLVVFGTISMVSLMGAPRLFSALSKELLKQEELLQEDVIIIKENLKNYVSGLVNQCLSKSNSLSSLKLV
ncbi:MAG: TetR/AcrR family transcriptional regulator [Alphaproteobacteria bacterium]|nr:TetR/AcrR family transcriptional regulator [Alphaproteobacteria bacterium]